MLWSPAALGPLALGLVHGYRLAWMRIASIGLEARIPRRLGVGLMGQSANRLDLRWDELQRVRLEVSATARSRRRMQNRLQQLNACRLVLTTARGATWVGQPAGDVSVVEGEKRPWSRLSTRDSWHC